MLHELSATRTVLCEGLNNILMEAVYSDGSVGRELQIIFSNLASTQGKGRPVNTLGLSKLMGLNVNIQEDSQEFFLKLLDKLNDGLESGINPAMIFQGVLEQGLTFAAANFDKKKTQSFKDLSISVNGQQSMYNSLENLFQPEKSKVSPCRAMVSKQLKKAFDCSRRHALYAFTSSDLSSARKICR